MSQMKAAKPHLSSCGQLVNKQARHPQEIDGYVFRRNQLFLLILDPGKSQVCCQLVSCLPIVIVGFRSPTSD